MRRATIRGLLAHKARLLLSAVAVVLGVAFLAGSLIFTDTLERTFEDLFSESSSDVTVSAEPAFETDAFDAAAAEVVVPASLLETVEGVEGVAEARGEVQVTGVRLLDDEGELVGNDNAGGLAVDWTDSPSSPLALTEGRAPEAEGEVALDTVTAEDAGFGVGDTVEVLLPEGRTSAEVVGIVRYGESGNLAGATLTVLDPATAQSLLPEPDSYSAIGVDAEEGTDPAQLRDRIAAELPEGFQTQTADEVAEEASADLSAGLGFINTLLLAFAGVALFVGIFLILNTFSMIVAQRTRELALLRAIGASRRQITRSVLGEALAVGLVGSLVGLAAGAGIAYLLQGAFSLIGLELTTGSLVFSRSTILTSLVVGVLVTLVAAYLPARRAARVAPVQALREDTAMAPRSLRTRAVVGAVLALLGAGALTAAVQSDSGSTGGLMLALGVLLVLLAAIALAPTIGSAVVGAIGSPLRSTVGRLGVRNAQRNPRRTSATASALMIGLALVSAFGVLAASVNASLSQLLDDAIGSEFIVTDRSFQGFASSVSQELGQVDGVAEVVRVRTVPVLVDGEQGTVDAVDVAGLEQAAQVEVREGDLADLETGVGLSQEAATARGLALGDPVELTFADGTATSLPVSVLYAPSDFLEEQILSISSFEEAGQQGEDTLAFVTAEDGADLGQVRADLDGVVEQYPTIQLQDQAELQEEQEGMINQLLYLIYGLLALAIIIAVLGIINTLALSVVERTREIGLLRALGLSRTQLRSTIRLESVVISVFGALLGLALGLVFGIVLQRVLASEGIEVLAVPWWLPLFLVVAAVVGVLAALWPARRAAKIDVLKAITSE